jgi:hypothetical protein
MSGRHIAIYLKEHNGGELGHKCSRATLGN